MRRNVRISPEVMQEPHRTMRSLHRNMQVAHKAMQVVHENLRAVHRIMREANIGLIRIGFAISRS